VTVPTAQEIIALNDADEINSSDKGNARRFALLYRDVIRYVMDRDQWLVWNGRHWEPDEGRLRVIALTAGVTRAIRQEVEATAPGDDPDDPRSARNRLARHAFTTESLPSKRRMVDLAATEPGIQVTEEQLDSDPNQLVASNCTVDMLTGKCTLTKSSDLNTRCVRVPYDEDAKSPLLTQYLETFMPEPAGQEVLFALLGTALRGGNPSRLLPFILGHTTSGKSQLVAALDRLLGPYVCTVGSTIFRGNLDDKPRPDLVRAMYTRIAYAVEASKVWELHADQVKRITGGDAVPYRDLYSKVVEATPRFTPLIVTNEMPKIKGADPALKRRCLVVRFDRTLPPEKEDTTIKERFIHDERCLQALLARVVRGASSELMRNGVRWDLIPSKFALDTITAFGQMDNIDEFLMWMRDEGHLVEDDDDLAMMHSARVSSVHGWYAHWISKHGDKMDKSEALNLTKFNASLRERGWQSAVSNGTRWMGKRLLSEKPTLFEL